VAVAVNRLLYLPTPGDYTSVHAGIQRDGTSSVGYWCVPAEIAETLFWVHAAGDHEGHMG
jgi:hypothetical protein